MMPSYNGNKILIMDVELSEEQLKLIRKLFTNKTKKF